MGRMGGRKCTGGIYLSRIGWGLCSSCGGTVRGYARLRNRRLCPCVRAAGVRQQRIQQRHGLPLYNAYLRARTMMRRIYTTSARLTALVAITPPVIFLPHRARPSP